VLWFSAILPETRSTQDEFNEASPYVDVRFHEMQLLNQNWIWPTDLIKPPNIKSPESLRSRSRDIPCGRTDMKKPTVAFCSYFVNALKRDTKQLPVYTIVWNLTTDQRGTKNVTWNFKFLRLHVCYFKYVTQCVILLLVSMQNGTHLQWLISCHKPKFCVFMDCVEIYVIKPTNAHV
jgi:hypothetical protein